MSRLHEDSQESISLTMVAALAAARAHSRLLPLFGLVTPLGAMTDPGADWKRQKEKNCSIGQGLRQLKFGIVLHHGRQRSRFEESLMDLAAERPLSSRAYHHC